MPRHKTYADEKMQSLAELSNKNIINFYLDELHDFSNRGIRNCDIPLGPRKQFIRIGVLVLAKTSKWGGPGYKVNWERVESILA